MNRGYSVSQAQDIDCFEVLKGRPLDIARGESTVELCNPRKLRVAILIDSFKQPVWVSRITQEISESCFAEISMIVKYEYSENGSKRPKLGLIGLGNSLLWDIYSKLDNRSLCPYRDPFEKFDVRSNLGPNCELIQVAVSGDNGEARLEREDTAIIHSQGIDVILDLGNIRLNKSLQGVARYGIWSGGTSNNSKLRQGPPGFWEVMRNETTTEFTLKMAGSSNDSCKILYRSWTSTDLFSVKGNRSKVYWKSANAIVRALRNLHEWGPGALEEKPSCSDVSLGQGPMNISPTNAQMVIFLARMAVKRLRLRLRGHTRLDQWFLAYNLGDVQITEQSLDQLNYMEPPKGRFWADPFPIERDGTYFIFLEEFVYEAMKAHISVIEMDSEGNWNPPVKVLERDYHLSYPFLFEWEGNLYMIPETKRNKTIELYRCVEFPMRWEFETVLMDDVQAVDTTLHEKDGLWWLFSNIGGKDFASNDELHIFYSETPFGPWIPHKRNPVKSDVRSARPAGRLFYQNGDLFRPAQDCSERMGGAMCLNRVISLTTEDFKEEVVTRIEPKWMKGLLGAHTFNTAGRLTMLDCFRYIPKSSG